MAVNDLIPLHIFFQKEKYLYHKYFMLIMFISFKWNELNIKNNEEFQWIS